MTGFAGDLQACFGGFGVEAWAENGLPDGAALPLITYECREPDWFEPFTLRAWVWFRRDQREAAMRLCGQVCGAIAGGVVASDRLLCGARVVDEVSKPGGEVRGFVVEVRGT